MRAAQAQGAELRLGRVTELVKRDEAPIAGVEVDGEIVEGDAVVIAMGPWSILAAAWLPLPAVFGLKGHSLVFDDRGEPSRPRRSFSNTARRRDAMQTPELFPRADGTTYVCAISSESPLPVDPAEVAPDPGAIERLEAMCRDLSPVLACGEDSRAAGLLPSDRARRAAADRPGAGRRRRLCRDRAQRLGHPQRAGDRRGDGGADRRRRRAYASICRRSIPAGCRRSIRRGRAGPRAGDRRCRTGIELRRSVKRAPTNR